MEHREDCNHTPADKYGKTFCLKCDADGTVRDDGRFSVLVGTVYLLPEDIRSSDEIEVLEERNAVLNEASEKLEERLNANRVERHKNDLRIGKLERKLKRGRFSEMNRFKDRDTERLSSGERVSKLPPDILKRARGKVHQVLDASELRDLRFPNGNRLESLYGDRHGQHSIRINDQWRVCFIWTFQGAVEIEVNKHYER